MGDWYDDLAMDVPLNAGELKAPTVLSPSTLPDSMSRWVCAPPKSAAVACSRRESNSVSKELDCATA
jgi:hypothetical protein